MTVVPALNEGEKRRLFIFKKYAKHLQFLKDNGLLQIDLKYDETYICPVCTVQFSIDALDQSSENPLTLEDAPPKSLGGKAGVLTCRNCNNTCGHQIDHHLTSRLHEIDHKKFIPGVSYSAVFEKDGIRVNGIITINEGGQMTVIHDEKKNNPAKLKEYLSKAGSGEIININFGNSKADNHRLQLALLKSGYLLTFAKFGYDFLLNPTYDRLRDQLRFPDQQIYPEDAWFNAPELKIYYGIPIMIEPGIESIFPIFPLKTDLTEHSFAVIIPLSTRPIEEVIEKLRYRFSKTSGFGASMDPMDADYLTNLEAINKMLHWIEKFG
jgi:hypothetical protein